MGVAAMRYQIQTGRDPFARQDVRKSSEHGKCSFCGNSNRYGKVWKYRVEPDAGRTYEISGHFCSIGCVNAYHN
jgi:hypothetical protein